MKRPLIIGIILLGLNFCSCGFEERRKQLDEREQALKARETAVMLKEKALKLLEDSLKLNIARIDSVSNLPAEQSVPLPDSLAGNWNVTMVCTQTNCSGFAVGDIRKETWLIAGNETTVTVRAMQGDKLIRIYTGTFTGTDLKLSTPESETAQPSASMKVALKVEQRNKLSGQRLITQPDGCETIFKADMDRPKNQ
ncbi:hypothetical protein [Niabella drilacis]|uniref:Uncharacterized protein n=1 Tax=Niabella drilacis (strain DSM 25811 / CCM 8410 / CCUG 62505 / LMG 26954 / E90) TaxID=1285928 RepID=A0A1G6UZY6_NIADE|nr:hypothetical protein [Niabella drilacis]SDD46205.1 hypothetical protein SAMN04487894_109127 [Niabella drilacis]